MLTTAENVAGYVVALFTRAWIEMVVGSVAIYMVNVALFTRAWIEMFFDEIKKRADIWSPSSRGRGLKSLMWQEVFNSQLSLSSRGRGLKYCS